MTDDEKKRLEDLLNDLDTLPEAVEDDDSISNVSRKMCHTVLSILDILLTWQ